MQVQFLTGIFKLHNPSQWRQKLLDRTIREYTHQVRSTLDWAKEKENWIEENGVNKRGRFTEQSLKSLIPSPKQADMSSALKDALVSNVSSVLASYFTLKNGDKQDSTGFPSVLDSNGDGYSLALDRLCGLFLENGLDTTKEQAEQMEDQTIANLMRLAKDKSLPIHFVRSRDFTILADTQKQRLFVYLKLASNVSNDNLQTDISGNNLVDVSTGEIFNKQAGVGVLFPIEIGDRGWQYNRFILPTLKQQAYPKAAKLVRQGDDYYLHVSFAFDCPDPYEPETYLGVDRGVFFTAAYAVVDSEGQIITQIRRDDGYRESRITAGKRVRDKQRKGQQVTVKDYRGKYLDGILHQVANELIEAALTRRSMIVMEDLNIRITGKFFKSAWCKLYRIVEYKCRLNGVPFKKDGVWAAWTSKLCVNCGEVTERPERDVVICYHCGHRGHADEDAAVNIARRAMYRKADWGGTKSKPGDWRAFHRSFANILDLSAKIDLQKEKEARQLSLL